MAGTDIEPQLDTDSDLLALDHVALTVGDAAAMTAFLRDHVGMHELGRSADATLVGADAGAAKLSLIEADGPREPGVLGRLVLRVADLRRAVALLPADTQVQEDEPGIVTFEGPEGLSLGLTLVVGGGIDYDVDEVVLRVADPDETRIALAEVGFVLQGGILHIADKRISLQQSRGATDRPLLDHIAVRVGSIQDIAAQARERGLEIREDSADDTFTIVLRGPEQIRVDFVAGASGD